MRAVGAGLQPAEESTVKRVFTVMFPCTMNDQILLTAFNGNPPALLSTIEQVEAELGFALPNDYGTFLQTMNGGEGCVGSGYAALWKVEELIPALL